ncbi:MAG: hypothetical protein OEN02_01180, partial [Gammaproteobacteria bacterium]|nr:hypothetical protein [Gammaproteobacteria bacterium]
KVLQISKRPLLGAEAAAQAVIGAMLSNPFGLSDHDAPPLREISKSIVRHSLSAAWPMKRV